jgi:hypothetical protein
MLDASFFMVSVAVLRLLQAWRNETNHPRDVKVYRDPEVTKTQNYFHPLKLPKKMYYIK